MNIFIAFQLILCVLLLHSYYGNAEKSVEFKIRLKISEHKETVRMDEVEMEAFFKKMKHLITNYAIPNFDIKQECAKFKNLDEKSEKIEAIKTLKDMLKGNGEKKFDASEGNHCFYDWVLYVHLVKISKEIIEKLENAIPAPVEIYHRIVGIQNEIDKKRFKNDLNEFLTKIETQRLNSMPLGTIIIQIDELNEAQKFYESLKALDVTLEMKEIEKEDKKIEVKKSVKFEMHFDIPGMEKEVKMDEKMTKTFIVEMKTIIHKEVPKIDGKICEEFKEKDAETTKKLAIESIIKMLKGEDKIDEENHCYHNWVLYFHLAKLSEKIVEKLKEAKDKEIENRILGTKNSDEQTEFIGKLNTFIKDIEKQLNSEEASYLSVKRWYRGKNDAQKFFELLQQVLDNGVTVKMELIEIKEEKKTGEEINSHQNINSRVRSKITGTAKKMYENVSSYVPSLKLWNHEKATPSNDEKGKEAKKSVKFEIHFEGFEHEVVKMDEVKTTAFIAEMKTIIKKEIPKIDDKICEKFKEKDKEATKKMTIELISNMLNGKEKIDDDHCFNNWVIYIYLGKISKKIIHELNKSKNHDIEHRILGVKNADEQKEFIKHLETFLNSLDEKLKPGWLRTATKYTTAKLWPKNDVPNTKEKYYEFLKILDDNVKVKMEEIVIEGEKSVYHKLKSRLVTGATNIYENARKMNLGHFKPSLNLPSILGNQKGPHSSNEKNKLVKFEIHLKIPGHEEEVKMDEKMTTAFIAEIKTVIKKEIPKEIDKICENFKEKDTETAKKEALQSISKMLEGKGKIEDEHCFNNWILYLHLAKIAMKIIQELNTTKNLEIEHRILGVKNADEQKEFIKHLEIFLKIEEKLKPKTGFLNKFGGTARKYTKVLLWHKEEKNDIPNTKEKFYELLEGLDVTVKMEIEDEKSLYHKFKSGFNENYSKASNTAKQIYENTRNVKSKYIPSIILSNWGNQNHKESSSSVDEKGKENEKKNAENKKKEHEEKRLFPTGELPPLWGNHKESPKEKENDSEKEKENKNNSSVDSKSSFGVLRKITDNLRNITENLTSKLPKVSEIKNVFNGPGKNVPPPKEEKKELFVGYGKNMPSSNDERKTKVFTSKKEEKSGEKLKKDKHSDSNETKVKIETKNAERVKTTIKIEPERIITKVEIPLDSEKEQPVKFAEKSKRKLSVIFEEESEEEDKEKKTEQENKETKSSLKIVMKPEDKGRSASVKVDLERRKTKIKIESTETTVKIEPKISDKKMSVNISTTKKEGKKVEEIDWKALKKRAKIVRSYSAPVGRETIKRSKSDIELSTLMKSRNKLNFESNKNHSKNEEKKKKVVGGERTSKKSGRKYKSSSSSGSHQQNDDDDGDGYGARAAAPEHSSSEEENGHSDFYHQSSFTQQHIVQGNYTKKQRRKMKSKMHGMEGIHGMDGMNYSNYNSWPHGVTYGQGVGNFNHFGMQNQYGTTTECTYSFSVMCRKPPSTPTSNRRRRGRGY